MEWIIINITEYTYILLILGHMLYDNSKVLYGSKSMYYYSITMTMRILSDLNALSHIGLYEPKNQVICYQKFAG